VPATLTVMTYNVNFGVAGDDSTMAAIRDGGADVVFLQEPNEAWERAIRNDRALVARYPHMTFHPCCRAGGLAVLSKLPYEEKELIDPPEGGWFPALRVIVHAGIGDVQVLSVHLHPPLDEHLSVIRGYFATKPIREREMKTYAPHLEDGLPTLVVGDFNEDADGRAVAVLTARGMESTLYALHGDVRTWHWPTAMGEISHQLDHVMHDDKLVPISAKVIETGRSDHFPVVVVFRPR
jgi:endonuclease/exonuclease/phosphatase family metal-dependent hydrolase